MLALSRAVHVVREPFNVEFGDWLTRAVPHWFEYVTDQNEDLWTDDFERVAALRYPIIPRLRGARDLRTARDVVSQFVASTWARRRHRVPLIKDPMAVFSTPWLERRFDVRPVVMIRRPEAFVGSVKRFGWRFESYNLFQQPLLIEGPLAPVADELWRMAESAADFVDEGIIIWIAVYTAVDQYRRDHPQWLFLRHEDLALEPARQFEALYRHLGLPWTKPAAAGIAAYSDPRNPAEVDQPNAIARDSRGSLTTWRRRLTPDELARVRDATAPLATRFYGEAATALG